MPDLPGVGDLDAVVFSHAHPDHVGAHALLADRQVGAIWATARTWEELGPRLDHPAARQALPVRGRAQVAGVTVTTGRTGHAPGGIWLPYLADVDPDIMFHAYDPRRRPPPPPPRWRRFGPVPAAARPNTARLRHQIELLLGNVAAWGPELAGL